MSTKFRISDASPTDSVELFDQVVGHTDEIVNACWKILLCYFLDNELSGEQKTCFVRICLIALHENEIKVVPLTSDGTSSNFTMMKNLGCNFHYVDN